MTQSEHVVTRTVELRAWRFNGEDERELPEWVHARMMTIGRMALEISSEQGTLICQRGSWVVQDINGDVGVCPPEVFVRRYQSLSGDAHAVQLAMQTTLFLPGQWNAAIVERAAAAFHGSDVWDAATEGIKAATRQGIRKALTAAIAPVNKPSGQ